MKNLENVQEYLIKIADFAQAIKLDKNGVDPCSIVPTMVEEIQNYAYKAVSLLTE